MQSHITQSFREMPPADNIENCKEESYFIAIKLHVLLPAQRRDSSLPCKEQKKKRRGLRNRKITILGALRTRGRQSPVAASFISVCIQPKDGCFPGHDCLPFLLIVIITELLFAHVKFKFGRSFCNPISAL